MAILNTRPVVDIRKPMSGKDGALFDGDGTLMASVESFQSQAAITNQTFQPLGDAQEHGVMTSFKITLTLSEIVVEDSRLFRYFMDAMAGHRMPVLNFRGMVRSPYDDSEEQIVYRDCVPDGTIDIQNMQVGELYKRSWTFIVNQVPDMQSMFQNA
jgi:hypothetical protein